MTEEQLKRIAVRAYELLPMPTRVMLSGDVAKAVSRATFEVRGNHSEVHLSEGELFALALLAADMQRKELR